jgi:hypothetical protein
MPGESWSRKMMDYEKLGLFYLGKEYDLECKTGQRKFAAV